MSSGGLPLSRWTQTQTGDCPFTGSGHSSTHHRKLDGHLGVEIGDPAVLRDGYLQAIAK